MPSALPMVKACAALKSTTALGEITKSSMHARAEWALSGLKERFTTTRAFQAPGSAIKHSLWRVESAQ